MWINHLRWACIDQPRVSIRPTKNERVNVNGRDEKLLPVIELLSNTPVVQFQPPGPVRPDKSVADHSKSIINENYRQVTDSELVTPYIRSHCGTKSIDH